MSGARAPPRPSDEEKHLHARRETPKYRGTEAKTRETTTRRRKCTPNTNSNPHLRCTSMGLVHVASKHHVQVGNAIKRVHLRVQRALLLRSRRYPRTPGQRREQQAERKPRKRHSVSRQHRAWTTDRSQSNVGAQMASAAARISPNSGPKGKNDRKVRKEPTKSRT